MLKETIFYKLLGTIGVVFGPLLFMPLPSILFPPPYETPAENFRALAGADSGGIMIPLLMQLLGAALIVPGALGMVHLLLSRRRVILPGHIGGGLAVLGAFSAMVMLGIEMAQNFLLLQGRDKEAMISLALALNESAVFGIFLFTALIGIFLGLLILVISLTVARFIPVWLPAMFLLPLAIGLLPLQIQFAGLANAAALAAPFVWIGWLMIQRKEEYI
jgi:hypothetical protein